MMKVKYQNIYLKLKYQHLSENDVLTDLRNRNSFEQILESKNYHPAYCIYIDVNGLPRLSLRFEMSMSSVNTISPTSSE